MKKLNAQDYVGSRVGDEEEGTGLPVVRKGAAGIDLGSEEHWVCAPKAEGAGREVAKFGATTPELERMAAWLKERKIETVAMESTGVYWIAPHEVLERCGFELVLVNTRELARVPGRKKTDRIDSKWIGHKRDGMVSLSWTRLTVAAAPVVKPAQLRSADRFVPTQRGGVYAADAGAGQGHAGGRGRRLAAANAEEPGPDERAGADHRRRCMVSLVQDKVCISLRLWPAVSDIDGVTGMAIIRAIVDGERDAHRLAQLRDGRCHKSEEEIAEQLSGHWREDHLFSLKQALKMYDSILTGPLYGGLSAGAD